MEQTIQSGREELEKRLEEYKVSIFENQNPNGLRLSELKEKFFRYLERKKAEEPYLGMLAEVYYPLRNGLKVNYDYYGEKEGVLEFMVEGQFEKIRKSLDAIGQIYHGLIFATKLEYKRYSSGDSPNVYILFGGKKAERISLPSKKYPLGIVLLNAEDLTKLPNGLILLHGTSFFSLKHLGGKNEPQLQRKTN